MPFSPARSPARPAARRSHPAGSGRPPGADPALAADDLARLAARLASPIDPVTAHRHGETRWWVSLGATRRWDAWLEGWPEGDAIDLHDHGGSTAVVKVLAGHLLETWLDPAREVRRRRLEAGTTVWLPRQHIHDLVNVDPVPALSVHVYSPPLRTMTWYCADTSGGAVPIRRQALPPAETA